MKLIRILFTVILGFFVVSFLLFNPSVDDSKADCISGCYYETGIPLGATFKYGGPIDSSGILGPVYLAAPFLAGIKKVYLAGFTVDLTIGIAITLFIYKFIEYLDKKLFQE